ncbi:Translation initiation factor 2 subunit alpha [uncultured archaeon]|nr:Translation initiation factor 2 subunit alpha [uncultured archaeon]
MRLLILQKNLPELGEIVLVKINKIMPHGAYCELVEYKTDSYLPIGEVASGWIKNIHERIKEGQRDVAKVVFVDPSRRAIDVSLKKVSTKEKKEKITEYTLEKRAEKFFVQAIGAAHEEAKSADIKRRVAQKVQTYTELLERVQENKLDKDILDDDVRAAFVDIISKNIKPKSYTVAYTVELTASSGKGNIKLIRKIYGEIEALGVEVVYEGAPHYKIIAEGPSYAVAEGKIKEAQQVLQKHSDAFDITVKK